jgi:hypothetical protein
MEINTCPHCGSENPAEASLCQNCGADLSTGLTPGLAVEDPGLEAYPGKVRVTPAQQVHLRLLQEVLAAEGQPKPVKSASPRANDTLIRLGVGFVLCLVLILSLVTGQPVFTRPTLSTDALEARQLIFGLTPGAPILMAFDFQPGYAGEMSRVAQGVLTHLLVQRTYPVFLSTTPTGAAQVELLVSAIAAGSNTTYLAPDQYLNLGYLPGGPTGLLGFSQAPARWMPLTADGNLAWSNPAVSEIQRLADFKMVIVATEDPEAARAWIEQVSPQLAGTPLVLLVSAQAEPALLPYTGGQSGQVQGVINGVAGGLAYQDSAVFTLEDDPSGISWSTYSLGLWAGAVLLLLAGLMAAVRLAREEDSTQKPGEKQP